MNYHVYIINLSKREIDTQFVFFSKKQRLVDDMHIHFINHVLIIIGYILCHIYHVPSITLAFILLMK